MRRQHHSTLGIRAGSHLDGSGNTADTSMRPSLRMCQQQSVGIQKDLVWELELVLDSEREMAKVLDLAVAQLFCQGSACRSSCKSAKLDLDSNLYSLVPHSTDGANSASACLHQILLVSQVV